MTDEEYIEFAHSLSKTCTDPYETAMALFDCKQAREELVDFYRREKIDMTYMRDYSRDGWYETEKNWEKFVLKYIEILDKYDFGADPDELDEDDEG